MSPPRGAELANDLARNLTKLWRNFWTSTPRLLLEWGVGGRRRREKQQQNTVAHISNNSSNRCGHRGKRGQAPHTSGALFENHSDFYIDFATSRINHKVLRRGGGGGFSRGHIVTKLSPQKPFHLETPEAKVVTRDPTTLSLACKQNS